jgi:hypothetical protein
MKKRDDYWTCPKCKGRNHFSSDSCYSSPGCRADELEYWARYYERKAAELRGRAKQARDEEKNPVEYVPLD